METQEEKVDLTPKSAKTWFVVKNVRFDTMEEAIAILKNDSEITKQDWLEFFEIFLKDDHEEHLKPFIRFITEKELFEIIDATPALTVQEVFVKYHENAEQLMRALSYFDPENIIEAAGGELLNEETITKKQKRTISKNGIIKNDVNSPLTDDMFEVVEVSYDDTYKLHRISKEKLGVPEDAYTVECNCTSTGRKYFLFVEQEFATTAIDAVASTMRDAEGNRMNRQQYLEIEAES